MPREIELKLDLEPGSTERVSRSEALAGVEPQHRSQLACYFDTRSGKFASNGFSLRVRRSGNRNIQTLKLSRQDAAGMFDREEWEWEVPGLEVDRLLLRETEAAGLLKRDTRLVPLFEVEIERSVWKLEDVELSLDRGKVRRGDDEAAVHELELEAEGASAHKLFRLAREIAREAPLRLGVLSKSERGQRLLDGRLGRFSKAEPVSLPADATVAEGVAAIGYNCLRHYRLNEMVLLDQPDANALHQARVAMRRLRSSFSLFGGVVRDADHERLRDELRWFTGILGPARNFDVMIRRLPKKAKGSEEIVREALEAARQEAYRAGLTAIRSERLRFLMLDLVQWLTVGPWRDGRKAKQPLAILAVKRLDHRWNKVQAAGANLAALAPEPRHRLRIDIKKMRYAAEFLRDLHGNSDERRATFLAALEELQEQLGQLNDAATAEEVVQFLPLDPDARAMALELTSVDHDEAECITRAELASASLAAVGPYWRE